MPLISRRFFQIIRGADGLFRRLVALTGTVVRFCILLWHIVNGVTIDVSNDLVHRRAIALLFQNLRHSPGFRRGYFDGGLIGFDHDDVFIAFDKVPFVLEPLADGYFGNRFAHFRYFNWDRQGQSPQSGDVAVCASCFCDWSSEEAVPNALSSNCFCCSLCRVAEPVAGLADGVRATKVTDLWLRV